MPAKVAAHTAYENARKHSDRQKARVERDKALAHVRTAVLKEETELFKQFSDDESRRRWLADTVCALIAPAGGPVFRFSAGLSRAHCPPGRAQGSDRRHHRETSVTRPIPQPRGPRIDRGPHFVVGRPAQAGR